MYKLVAKIWVQLVKLEPPHYEAVFFIFLFWVIDNKKILV